MKITVLGLLAGIVFLGSTAHADINYKSYRATKAEAGMRWTLTKVYLNGLGDAYKFSNIKLRADHKPPFYCPPPTLVIEVENLVDILDREFARISDSKDKDDAPVSMVLLVGLMNTFPCKSANAAP
jgi:hypothetical protein